MSEVTEPRRAEHNVAVALDLTETGMRMVGERYRREHPDATEAEIEAHMQAWLLDRPGAPDGDCVGRKVDFPRSS